MFLFNLNLKGVLFILLLEVVHGDDAGLFIYCLKEIVKCFSSIV